MTSSQFPLILTVVLFLSLYIVCWVFVFRNAGHTSIISQLLVLILSLLTLIPAWGLIIAFLLFLFLAFSNWPVQRELGKLRQRYELLENQLQKKGRKKKRASKTKKK